MYSTMLSKGNLMAVSKGTWIKKQLDYDVLVENNKELIQKHPLLKEELEYLAGKLKDKCHFQFIPNTKYHDVAKTGVNVDNDISFVSEYLGYNSVNLYIWET